MFFKNKKIERKVTLEKSVLDSIVTFCKMKHPNEGILILKGKSKTILSEIDEINSQIPELISKIESKLRIFSNSKYVISKS